MAFPKLSDPEIDAVIQQVIKYIDSQRQTYRGNASPLDDNQKAVVAPFFPQSVLDSTRVVALSGQRVSNPPFYGELIRIGFESSQLPDFSEMTAITYVDTVVSHEPFTDRLLFHELVHVLQYQKLGLGDRGQVR